MKESISTNYVIPDNIDQVTDEILDQILHCEISRKEYKIIPQELAFYRKTELPIPRLHPDQRHRERLKNRPPRQLWKRNCQKC
jgi:hypothetical protein